MRDKALLLPKTDNSSNDGNLVGTPVYPRAAGSSTSVKNNRGAIDVFVVFRVFGYTVRRCRAKTEIRQLTRREHRLKCRDNRGGNAHVKKPFVVGLGTAPK